MANPWLAHVKETARKHKGMKFKDVLKHAKKTYKRKAHSGKHRHSGKHSHSGKHHSGKKTRRRSRGHRRR